MTDIILYSVLGIAALMLLYFILKAFLVGIVIAMMIKKQEIDRQNKEQQSE